MEYKRCTGKLPPNVYSIQVHAIILPSFFLTKPDLDKINGFIPEKSRMTSRKSTKMYNNEHVRVPFFRILQRFQQHNSTAEYEIHKIKIHNI